MQITLSAARYGRIRPEKWQNAHLKMAIPELYERNSKRSVLEALSDTRVVFLLGARQVGKSTLARRIATNEHPATIVDLDDPVPRKATFDDPVGFVTSLDRPVFVDEIQRGDPELVLAIKSVVDRDMSPGQFLLAGSANLFRNPRVLDALTGRAEIVTLWPLTQAETERSTGNFVEALYAADPPRIQGATRGRDALRRRVAAGGYPQARLRGDDSRSRWFDSYLRLTIERDLESIADAYKLYEIPKLLRLLASQAANLCVPASLGNKLSLNHQTVDRYVGLLEATFLVKRIPAWRPGLGQREVRHPKAYVVDSGLLLHLLRINEERLLHDEQVTGKALENFVAMEIARHAEWAAHRPRLFHYRRDRDEVDLLLEDRAGDVVAIEVKATASLDERDWRALTKIRDSLGERFRCGCVIHLGADTIPLGDRLFALPLSVLWA